MELDIRAIKFFESKTNKLLGYVPMIFDEHGCHAFAVGPDRTPTQKAFETPQEALDYYNDYPGVGRGSNLCVCQHKKGN